MKNPSRAKKCYDLPLWEGSKLAGPPALLFDHSLMKVFIFLYRYDLSAFLCFIESNNIRPLFRKGEKDSQNDQQGGREGMIEGRGN